LLFLWFCPSPLVATRRSVSLSSSPSVLGSWGAASPSGHSISSVFFRSLGGAPDRGRVYLDAGKARAQNIVRTFAPCDRPPSMFWQLPCQALGAHRFPSLPPRNTACTLIVGMIPTT
jgi:hypothetical protein